MYILLHGAIRNAGDFLIKDRAIALLRRFRPEQELVELPRWKPVDDHLDIVNSSDALILCGGPAFQPNLYPGIYPLTKNLDDIRPPIIPMGLGWKHPRGEWSDTWNYRFTPSSTALLKRIADSGFVGSCRDYHTLNALAHQGVTNLFMTGCPAWYNLDTLNQSAKKSFAGEPVNKVAFSLGVRMYRNASFRKNTLLLLERLRERFGKRLECVFHHPINTHDNAWIVDFLVARKIPHVDISGGVEKMVAHYRRIDLHIGFRVHAHILMMSQNGRSVLIAEDGRGVALKTAMGGAVVNPFTSCESWLRIRRRPHMVDESILDIIRLLEHEERAGYPLSQAAHMGVRAHFSAMKNFLNGLPSP